MGWIPGIQLAGNTNITGYLRIEFNLSAYRGTIDYQGHTNKGVPHQTRTDETLSHQGLRLVSTFTPQADFFLGVQSREWQRDIRDNNGVFGLFEKYRWHELSTGLDVILSKNSTQQWLVEIGVLKIIAPELFVDLSKVNGGTANLSLGEKLGGRLKLTWAYMLSSPWTMNVNAYAEAWDFGRSDLKRTTTGAMVVSEPRSETRNAGLQLALQYTF